MSTVRELVIKLLLDASGLKSEAERSQSQLEGIRRASEEVQSQSGSAAKAVSSAARESQRAWDGININGPVAALDQFGSTAQNAVAVLIDALARVSRALQVIGSDIDRATGQARSGFTSAARAADSFGREVGDSGDSAARALRNAGSAADKAGKQIQEAAQDGASAWDNLKDTLLGALSIGAAVGGAMNFVEQTKQLSQYSSQLGMTVEQWQAWQGAGEQMGIEAQDLYDTFRDMGDWTIDMVKNDSGPFKDFAKQTGLSLKDAKGNMVDTQEALLRLSDAVQGMKPDEATGWLTQMGVDATSISLILKGRKAIEGLVAEMREKAVYDKRDLENSARLQAAWQNVTRVFQRLTATGLDLLAPAIEWISQKSEAFFKYVKENGESVQTIFVTIGTVISTAVIPKLVRMGAAAWASLGPFALIPAAIMAIGVAIDDLMVWLEGGTSAFGEFWSLFGTPEEVSSMLKQALAGLEAAFDAVGEVAGLVANAVLGYWELVKSTISGLVEVIGGVVTAFKGLFTGDWNTVLSGLDAVKKGLGAVGDVVSAVAGKIMDSFGKFFGWIADKLAGLVPDWLKDLISGDHKEGRRLDADSLETDVIEQSKKAAASGRGPTFTSDREKTASLPQPTLTARPGETGSMQQALGEGRTFAAGQAAAKGGTSVTTNNNQRTITQTNNINITTQSDNPDGIAQATSNAINPRTTATESDTGIGV
ncbi:hypothetical protein B5F76_09285 [Desulfovibrio sp. An276]|uniref:hypothetical protein n=1 Tax=Desulfovibrio sp. An276 TaxID=1965618 RepID=UPI000B390440|nr:hypothetical protein [Desulfovibrio sp. An276]OUO51667.1 hypothetical protein B5F76_09285 [Desulfovibrio sp. An276]